jgi:oligoribonuclease NrnB/cAMP/cGMP phosphodiesterase (DHH superfamily)
MDAKKIYDRLKLIDYDIDKIDTVLYHNNCPDGFGAAWIVWRHLKRDATYIGVTPDKLPSISQLKNKYVIILDVSIPETYLEEIKKNANNVLLVDHHNTYVEELENNTNTIFDKDHSAIYISWRIFNPDEKIPQFIRYIEDNDLALYEIKKTDAFMAALGTKLPFHNIDFFKSWNKLLNPAFVDSLIQDGIKYQEYKNYLLKRNLHIAQPMKLGNFNVLIANFGTVGLASDLGNKLSEQNPKYDFVILWSYHSNNKEYSVMLRSRNDNSTLDLSQIAKIFGGGGHSKAARFAWKGPIDALWDEMNARLYKKEKKRQSQSKSKTNHKY